MRQILNGKHGRRRKIYIDLQRHVSKRQRIRAITLSRIVHALIAELYFFPVFFSSHSAFLLVFSRLGQKSTSAASDALPRSRQRTIVLLLPLLPQNSSSRRGTSAVFLFLRANIATSLALLVHTRERTEWEERG